MQTPDFYQAFIAPVEKTGFDYFVTGAVAAILYGEPRLTHDIDLVINIPSSSIRMMTSLFSPDHYYCPPEEVIQQELRRPEKGQFNIIHHETGLKADLYCFGDDPLHRWALARRVRITLEAGDSLWMAPPEYVILRKLAYFREGGSQKHLSDIRGILLQQEKLPERQWLEDRIREMGLLREWSLCQKK